MASRQQRRQADRDICRDTYVPGVWWKQEEDVDVVVRAIGANAVRRKANEGSGNALYALGVMIKLGMQTPPTGGVDTRWSEVYEGEGFDCLIKASEKGHVYAEEFMADMFRISSIALPHVLALLSFIAASAWATASCSVRSMSLCTRGKHSAESTGALAKTRGPRVLKSGTNVSSCIAAAAGRPYSACASVTCGLASCARTALSDAPNTAFSTESRLADSS